MQLHVTRKLFFNNFQYRGKMKSSIFEFKNEQNKAPIGKTITLIRGLPGSGKSTEATRINVKHVEADMFFVKSEGYCFEGNKIKDAHAWCLSEAKYSLNRDEDVVVSNTFTRIEEMKPYIEASKLYGASLQIIECKGDYLSEHDVPEATIEIMKRRWEELPNDLKVYSTPSHHTTRHHQPA